MNAIELIGNKQRSVVTSVGRLTRQSRIGGANWKLQQGEMNLCCNSLKGLRDTVRREIGEAAEKEISEAAQAIVDSTHDNAL